MKIASRAPSDKKTITGIVIVGLIILLSSTWAWYSFVYTSAERVFWGMMDSSLQTRGVTRYIKQSSEAGSTEQYLQLELGANNVAKSLTTIEQKNAEGGLTRVVTESIGTSDANYSRYNEISTPEQVDFGATLDTWGREDATSQSETQSILSEAVFGVVPFARLGANQRSEIMQFVRDNNIYKTDFGTAQKTTVDGKTAYSYKVEIDTVKYIELLKLVDKMMGLNQLQLIDPNSYANSPTIPLEISVGVDSRQLLRTRYDAIEREEHFNGYGVQPGFEVPQNVVSRQELETQLQKTLLKEQD